MKQTLVLLILLIGMGFAEPCTIYSQALQTRDTLVSLTTSEVRALLKLKAERDYLFKQVSVLTRNDSISQMIMRDQNKSIDEWKMIVVERDRTIEELKGDIETQTNRKKFWRTTTLVGLPSALIGGILIVLL